MDRRQSIARLLVTLPAAFVALAPPVADLSESHILNPLWPAHARLHTVWLISTNSAISVIALCILWWPGQSSQKHSIHLASALVGAVLAGFFVAGITQSFYGGAFSDPNGVAVRVGPFDANLFAFSLLFVLVLIAEYLARRPERSG